MLQALLIQEYHGRLEKREPLLLGGGRQYLSLHLKPCLLNEVGLLDEAEEYD